MTLKALDLFCGGGGASVGLSMAGYAVTGVDIFKQPKYPYEFFRADALEFPLDGYDLIWASPVCKRFSSATRTSGTAEMWPDQIGDVRKRLSSSKSKWIIENVAGSPLTNPIMLCGTMFGLSLYRHRFFETSVPINTPSHNPHVQPTVKMGRPPQDGYFINPVGNFSGVGAARRAMGISWLGQKELSQAIPPAYSHYLALRIK